MPLVPVMDQHVPHVLLIIIDQQLQHVLYVQVSQIVRNVQQMQTNVVNVKQDLIPTEQHVKLAQLFTPNVPDVLKQRRHVQHVPKDIMSQEEVVLNVPIR